MLVLRIKIFCIQQLQFYVDLYIPDGQHPTRSRTSGRGWHTCPSLKFSLGTKEHYTFLRGEEEEEVKIVIYCSSGLFRSSIFSAFSSLPTLLLQTGVIWRLHVHHVHVLPKQLDDFIQLLVVAVAVHEYLKLRVASFGFSGLYVHKVDMVFLQETMRIILTSSVINRLMM